MSSPIPPDPYEALGVAKDADTAAVKSAHRKLVLKHHPDRIQDPALKEKGKDAFQKIQQAYELLVDPVTRQRYDNRIKLAELRREAMMRGDNPVRSYPTRPAPASTAGTREYNADEGAYFETRKPRNADFDSSRERFEEPMRTSSRKYPDYDRNASSKKSSTPTEKPSSTSKPSQSWSKAFATVNAGLKVKKEFEKAKSSKTQETKERERRKARSDKEQQQSRRPHVVSEDESDSDTATRVTSSTIRPSKPSPRHAPEQSSPRPSPSARPPPRRAPDYGDEDSDEDDSNYNKWESHHQKTMEYLEKAQAGAGKRPTLGRNESGSFWTRRSGSENDRRPGSKHEYEEPRARPSMPTQNSAPGNLKTRVDERTSKDRRTTAPPPKEPAYDHRKEMPSFQRSQTMPASRSTSKKDTAPNKSSGLKHTETHDSGYGSSSSPHTPDLRDESPPRRGQQAKPNSTRYQIVDPVGSDDDGRTRIYKMESDSDHRRRRYASPEPVDRRYRSPEPERRREKPDRARVNTHTRSKSSRDSNGEMPKMRRGESARESPRDSPVGRGPTNNSRDKLYREVDEEPGYKYDAPEKPHSRAPYGDPKFASYTRETPEARNRDYAPSSHFNHGLRHPESRRGSVY